MGQEVNSREHLKKQDEQAQVPHCDMEQRQSISFLLFTGMSRGHWSQPLQGHTPGPCWSLRWVAAAAPVGGPFSWFVTKGRDVGGEGGGQAQPACTSNQFIYLNNKHPAFCGASPRAVPEWDETLCLHRSPPTLPWGFNGPASRWRKWQASFRASRAVQECGWRQSGLLQWPEANSLLQGPSFSSQL